MPRHQKNPNHLNETLFLGIMSLTCFTLSLFRFVYSDTKTFLFLNWNLFLAFLPWLFSTILLAHAKLQKNKFIVIILIFSWLVFFPNAPYILTDLFHLQMKTNVPIWFDLVLILSFAWTGLMFGFISLWDIEKIIANIFNKKITTIISLGLLFIGSFGIYLGRYLRWNSWDIIKEPFALLYDISDRFLNPLQHPQTWGMTFFMFIFLTMIYGSLKFIKKRN